MIIAALNIWPLIRTVADGWVVRNMKQLELRESEEMHDDRGYIERVRKLKVPRSPRTANDDAAITGPIEDYLKAIYDIELQGGSASTNDIAARLSFAPGSVTGMIRRLADLGLLTYERYHGVQLTAAGRKAALRILRRHRVIESYLVQVLDYDWDGVHEEAERLEHAASDDLIDRMARAIGEPAVDPHGAPIPTREGTIDETQYCTLADLGPGHRVLVVRVTDDDPEVLRYFAELGIRPGVSLAVLAREPHDGPLTLAVAGDRLSLGAGLAGRVMVDLVADVTAPAH